MSVAFNDREQVTPFEPRHSIGPDHLIGSTTIEVRLCLSCITSTKLKMHRYNI